MLLIALRENIFHCRFVILDLSLEEDESEHFLQ
jgi:hypothetical protein